MFRGKEKMKKIFMAVILGAITIAESFAWEVRVGKDTVFTDVKIVYVVSGRNPAGGSSANEEHMAPAVYQIELNDGTVWTFCGDSGFFTDAPVQYTSGKLKKNK